MVTTLGLSNVQHPNQQTALPLSAHTQQIHVSNSPSPKTQPNSKKMRDPNHPQTDTPIIDVDLTSAVTDVSALASKQSPKQRGDSAVHVDVAQSPEGVQDTIAVQLTDGVAGQYKDYSPIIERYKTTMYDLNKMLKLLDTSRSFAIFFRKYPKIAIPLTLFAALGISAAFTPVFFAIVVFGASDSQSNQFIVRQCADLIKFLEYREKNTLAASFDLKPRAWEYLFRNPFFGNHQLNRYQQGVYNAIEKGVHSQDYLLHFSSWHENKLEKRTAVKTLIEKADTFYANNLAVIDQAIANKQASPIMDTFVRDYLLPLNEEAQLLTNIYHTRTDNSFNSYHSKAKGATNVSRNLEKTTLDNNQKQQQDVAESLSSIINQLDSVFWFYRSNSNSARAVYERANELNKKLQAATTTTTPTPSIV